MCISKRNGIYVTFVALTTVLLLAGCSKQEPAPAAATAAPAATPAPAPPATPKGLASTQGEVPGVTVTVQELKRGSNSLMLKFLVSNHSNTGHSYDFSGVPGERIADIHLIDAVNKKKYFVIKDTNGDCVCSGELRFINDGSQMLLWAQFPLPPDDVQKVTVEVPHFPPMDDVSISR